jgi:hypothetical protein
MSQRIGLGDGEQGQDIAMTLASIAYCDDIGAALQQYAPDWSLAWIPDAAVNGNFAYIALHKSHGQYIVAIRGSLLEFSWAAFDNWFEQDFNIFVQVNWTYPGSPQQPKISKGSSDGLTDLINLVQTSGGQQTTMLEYLLANAFGQDQSIGVVGHSLGGCLATVYAPWLLYQIGMANKPIPLLFPVFTFAAPPAGNTPFAQAFDATFPSSWRYFNLLDIVPMASVPLSIIGMGDLYTPAPQASQISVTYDGETVTLAEAFDAIAVAVWSSEILNGGSFYSQTNLTHGSEPLNTTNMLCSTTNTDPLVQWFEEAGCQHGHNTYLEMLGASQINCSLTALTP